MAVPKLTIRKDAGSVPEFLDIDCSDLDTTKTVELVINGVLRATIDVGTITPAELDSNLYLETWSSPSTAILPSVNGVVVYAVTSDLIKAQLSGFNESKGRIDNDGNIVLSKSDTSGNTIQMRYKV